MAKQYKYYACCKDMSGNGVTCAENPLGHICHLNMKE